MARRLGRDAGLSGDALDAMVEAAQIKAAWTAKQSGPRPPAITMNRLPWAEEPTAPANLSG
jgi:Family of unknown function (DUF6545)